MKPTAYACYNRDEIIRKNSSSGGIFYLLAKWTIAQGGVVCGAKFDQNWEVIHACAETLEDAMAFMTSKYVQSDTGDVFWQVKAHLQADRYVLFSGTPCQVAGLQSYLGQAYDKLITVDFACHGVPSHFPDILVR